MACNIDCEPFYHYLAYLAPHLRLACWYRRLWCCEVEGVRPPTLFSARTHYSKLVLEVAFSVHEMSTVACGYKYIYISLHISLYMYIDHDRLIYYICVYIYLYRETYIYTYIYILKLHRVPTEERL